MNINLLLRLASPSYKILEVILFYTREIKCAEHFKRDFCYSQLIFLGLSGVTAASLVVILEPEAVLEHVRTDRNVLIQIGRSLDAGMVPALLLYSKFLALL